MHFVAVWNLNDKNTISFCALQVYFRKCHVIMLRCESLLKTDIFLFVSEINRRRGRHVERDNISGAGITRSALIGHQVPVIDLSLHFHYFPFLKSNQSTLVSSNQSSPCQVPSLHFFSSPISPPFFGQVTPVHFSVLCNSFLIVPLFCLSVYLPVCMTQYSVCLFLIYPASQLGGVKLVVAYERKYISSASVLGFQPYFFPRPRIIVLSFTLLILHNLSASLIVLSHKQKPLSK